MLKANDLKKEDTYEDGVGVLRCGTCLRPLSTMNDETLTTIKADELGHLLKAISEVNRQANALLKRVLKDLPPEEPPDPNPGDDYA